MAEGLSVMSMTAVAPPYVQKKTRSQVERGAAPTRPGSPAANVGAVPGSMALPKERKTALPAERTKRKERAASRVIERPYMKLSFRTVTLFAVAIGVLMFIVYSNMQLFQIQKNNSALRAELAQLQRQENALLNQFENSVQLSEVEKYAKSELGMVKPDADQVIYIDLAGEDHAEVIEQKSFWDTISELLTSAMVQAGEFFD